MKRTYVSLKFYVDSFMACGSGEKCFTFSKLHGDSYQASEHFKGLVHGMATMRLLCVMQFLA